VLGEFKLFRPTMRQGDHLQAHSACDRFAHMRRDRAGAQPEQCQVSPGLRLARSSTLSIERRAVDDY